MPAPDTEPPEPLTHLQRTHHHGDSRHDTRPPSPPPSTSVTSPTSLPTSPRTKGGNTKWTEDDRARHGAEAAATRDIRLTAILTHLATLKATNPDTPPSVTSRDIAQMFSISLPTASIYLRLLYKQNKLKRHVTITYTLS